uniref:Uncharacterized protein n=1 Tax=Mycena chlorophos TaxID=658473 RepID=A0ABQ0LZ70_MYCCL|nr:predicted protein [Mycena chlorophos]
MCQWHTTGVEYACGHYIVTSLDSKHDCGSRYCTKSTRHNPSCRSLECIQYFGRGPPVASALPPGLLSHLLFSLSSFGIFACRQALGPIAGGDLDSPRTRCTRPTNMMPRPSLSTPCRPGYQLIALTA